MIRYSSMPAGLASSCRGPNLIAADPPASGATSRSRSAQSQSAAPTLRGAGPNRPKRYSTAEVAHVEAEQHHPKQHEAQRREQSRGVGVAVSLRRQATRK
jgi:hypothetical protein